MFEYENLFMTNRYRCLTRKLLLEEESNKRVSRQLKWKYKI